MPQSAADRDTADAAAGDAAAAKRSAEWKAALAMAPSASHWRELQACRATLLLPAADPVSRRVAEHLGRLQQTLMSVEGTREQFTEIAHAIDAELHTRSPMPEQAKLIAYADLQVQWRAADRRWPASSAEPLPRGVAAPA